MTDDFAAELEKTGLRPVDMANLAGVTRTTVWRWRHHITEVPEYAWTIVRQQQTIRELLDAIA